MNDLNEIRNDIQRLAAEIGTWLSNSALTIATAESCTAGGVANAIASVDGASVYLKGGFITYATEVKEQLLGISHSLIAENGVVSKEVAEAMAVAARQLTHSDIGIGVTGYIGTSGGDKHADNGTVFFCISQQTGNKVVKMQVDGCRQENSLLVIHRILETVSLQSSSQK